MPLVVFEVDTEASAYWLTVDETDIVIVNGTGSITLAPREDNYTLSWWFLGPSGTKLKVQGTLDDDPNRVIVKLESAVPDNEHAGGGRKRFKVPA